MNGDILLRIEGLMLERLLARAMDEGAMFHTVRRTSPHTAELRADPASAAILTALCEKFSLSCTVVSRHGIDAALRRIRSRLTLLAGMLTCLVCASLFLSRVWLIDVELTGERNASVQPIEDALQTLGIHPGMISHTIDTAALSGELAARVPEFSFVGVRLQGVRLLVEAAPAVPAPEVYDVEGARDLVALCDGVVLSVNVLSGNACVKPGDTVTRGQVLIEGTERITTEETRGIAALGTVVARTWTVGGAALPLSRTESIRTGRESISSELRLLQFAWPLTQGESYESCDVRTEILPIGGLFLPLEIRRTTQSETQARSVLNDESVLQNQLALLAFADAGAKLTVNHPDGCEIADRWIEYTKDAQGFLHARAVYETHIDIAVTRGRLYQQGG